MKVLHVITGLDVGGAERALHNIIEHSKQQSIFDSVVISLTGMGAEGPKLQAMGIEVTALHMRGVCGLPRALVRLVFLIRKHNPDVVQTWLYHADLFGGIAARLAGKKRVFWNVRNTDLLAGSGLSRSTYVVMRLCAILSYVVPAAIVCVAHAARKSHAAFGYCTKKMQVIPNGYNADAFIESINPSYRAKARAAFVIPDDAVVIGSVARFNHYKDHPNFIAAAALLSAKNAHVRFLMLGRDIYDGNATLMRQIQDTGFRERFILLNERHDLPLCFAAMDIFCLHSRSEAFPNVVMEAMCAGLPCVVTNVGDSAVMTGDTGIVVPAENAPALAAGLSELTQLTPEQRLLAGNKARQHVTQNYTLQHTVAAYNALYSAQ